MVRSCDVQLAPSRTRTPDPSRRGPTARAHDPTRVRALPSAPPAGPAMVRPGSAPWPGRARGRSGRGPEDQATGAVDPDPLAVDQATRALDGGHHRRDAVLAGHDRGVGA